MKIGIGALRDFNPEATGGRRYSIELIKALIPLAREKGDELVIFCSEIDEKEVEKLNFDCRIVVVPEPSSIPLFFRALIWGLRQLKLWLPRNLEWHAKRTKVDFIHFLLWPDYSYTGPCVLTLHCLQHEYFQEFWPNYKWRSGAYNKNLRRADVIITNSIYTTKSIKECLPFEFDHKSIIPAPLGGAENITIPKIEWKTMEGKYNIKRPYLIYPAANLRHKNHQRLLEALSILVHRDKMNIFLVFTGFEKYPRLEWEIERLNIKEQVFILGIIPDKDLMTLIKNSICMPFVSLFEGFGIPVIEAMALETPVVCSRVASLPEVGGDAVLYVDPLCVKDIADKLRMVITDESLIKKLVEKGKKQATKFTWEKCAIETYKGYVKIKEIFLKSK